MIAKYIVSVLQHGFVFPKFGKILYYTVCGSTVVLIAITLLIYLDALYIFWQAVSRLFFWSSKYKKD